MPPCTLSFSDMNNRGINVNPPEPFTILSILNKRKRPPMIEIPNALQVIESVKFTSENYALRSDVVLSSSGFGFGVCSVKGRKSFMEDNYTTVSSSSSKKGFFGVYDGHGGSKAADFVAKNLHSNIFDMLEKCCENSTTEDVVKSAFMKTDTEFLKQGGYVELHRGTWRVHGVLAVSRSIGDSHLKDWVLGEPETKVLPLTDAVEYLVLASDGLWDEVGNQEAIDIVTQCMTKLKKVCGVKKMKRRVNNNWKESENDEPQRKARRVSFVNQAKTRNQNQDQNENHGSTRDGLVNACKELLNLAVSRGSLDDITVMIVDLKAFQ